MFNRRSGERAAAAIRQGEWIGPTRAECAARQTADTRARALLAKVREVDPQLAVKVRVWPDTQTGKWTWALGPRA